MGKIDCKGLLKSAKRGANKYAPELLMIAGTVCFITAVVESWNQGTKAERLLEEKREELGLNEDEKLPAKEVVKTVWKNYVWVAIPAGLGIMCMVCSNSKYAKRNTAIAAAYEASRRLSEEAFVKYKEKVKETFGEKKAEQVESELAKDAVGNDPLTKAYIINTGHGTSLFKESLFGQYFLSDRNHIDRCINQFNERMLNDMYGTVDELYSEIGLPTVGAGGLLGWDVNSTGMVKPTFHYTEANDGTPCGVLGFYNLPGPAVNGNKRYY